MGSDGYVAPPASRLSGARAILDGSSETPFDKAAKEVSRLLEELVGQAGASKTSEKGPVASGSGRGRNGKMLR